jgi:cobyrinic acid a,c-diamide synthase
VVIELRSPRSDITLPRLVIAAPGSGHGKTTVATGLMSALSAKGLQVAGFKVGPDYIDPGYHTLATGRVGRNLDPYLCGEEQIVPLLLHGAQTPARADVAVIEGVMGLFDGQIGTAGFASTAHVACLVQAPVIMVFDISHMSRTAAAIVHGLNTFDPTLRLSGVIINKAGSDRHAREITQSLQATGIEVLGVLPRDRGIEIPSRHLGLVPASERAEAAKSVAQLGRRISDHVSLDSIMSIAQGASALDAQRWSADQQVAPPSQLRPVVAIAAGRAFTFRYAETDELLRAAGCEPVTFDPVCDKQLPAGTAGLYLGGGFPEVHATDLSINETLRREIRTVIEDGMPTVAECAGLLYLCRSLDGRAMVGAVEADASMTQRLTLSYRTVHADHDHLLAAGGAQVTGHDFHRTTVEPSHGPAAAWLMDGEPMGFSADPAGIGRETLHASYLHLHWAGHPEMAQRFANAVHDHAMTATGGSIHDLQHHGDRDVAEGLVDLAVNVRLSTPPEWLSTIINSAIPHLAAYPSTDAATKAIAEAHRVAIDQVLPTAGSAEAFTLIARAISAKRPLIIHPQFTEPEAALLAAGHHQPQRLILFPAAGFRLDVNQVPSEPDLVMVGNPTNPTSVLHPGRLIDSLCRDGRIVVVDEAFMDCVPGETETLISDDMTGLLVLRSLTKTWGLAGLRAGYVVGDPKLIAALRTQQPPWSVSTPALAAMAACLTPEARNEAQYAAKKMADDRAYLVEQLKTVTLDVAGQPMASFVLLDTSGVRGDHQPGWIRLALRDHGFAVRRGETFPGLGPDWMRIAVREPETTDRLVAALGRLVRL